MWWTGEKNICLWLDTDLGIIPVPLQPWFLSRIHALQDCPSSSLVGILSTDLWLHARGKLTAQSCLSHISPNKRKNLLFFSSQVEKVTPCCFPDLLPCCRRLPWSIALHNLCDANTAKTARRIDHKPEIYVRVEGSCCSAVTQVKVRALPFCSALDWARLWGLQSAPLWLQREFKLEFWPGSRQDEWDYNYWQIFAIVLGFKYTFMSQAT